MKIGAGRTASTIAATLVALAALAAGLFIAAHHPLSPVAMMAACLFVLVICVRFDHAWLLLLPALLPIVDLAPWTGWLSLEEFDVIALGAASGAWLRHGWAPGTSAPARTSTTLLLLVAVYLLLLGIAFVRGTSDAGGFEFGWFQGYEGSMNSLRLAKSFILAALFAPLLGRTNSRLDVHGVAYLGWGMALGLATASLAAIWERMAFPGLLNFSADYRTTALFWEMHVGGAALDGFLVLTLPFAVLLMLRSQRLSQLLPAGLILGLGIYASLTTFSRGVYLAAALALAAMALLLIARAHDNPATAKSSRIRAVLTGLLSAIVVLGLGYLVFRQGGYRATLAVLGSLTLFILTTEQARAATGRLWTAAIAIVIPLALLAFALVWFNSKGAYWAYVALCALTLIGWLATLRRGSEITRALTLAGSMSLPIAAALVANHWGGTPALGDASIALAVICLLAVWNIRARRPAWPTGLRQQGVVLASVISLTGLVAVFSGGAYIGERFTTSERDFQGRLQHWSAGLDLLETPGDWLVGKGLGRFPASFFFGAPGNEFPGSYQLGQEGVNRFLSLSGPRYQAGYGEVLRISQRVEPGPAGRYRLEFDVRTQGKAKLGFGICSKHLLYAESCGGREILASSIDPAWQHQSLEFNVPKLGGPWYAPQLVVFSLAIDTLGARADIDNLRLVAPGGRPVLANGDFSDDMARWFFTSDHHHMPWHMKNMFLHVLFEQGILGLAALGALIAVALFRSLNGRRAHHPLAPAMVAGIIGFLVVGLFDSLLDVPRVAFLFFLLLLLAIQGRKAG
ncbi:MAG: hypothetical protein AB1443_06020 [Pseudomonadota bacterium]